MKEHLYLKDDQLKEYIEKIFVSYKKSFDDAKKVLDKHKIGIAHHKAIHLISLHKGITVSELLNKLNVTKQSLNRVLKDLINLETIYFKKNETDSRLKHLFLSNKGSKIFDEIFSVQKKRIYKAFLNSDSNEVICFSKVLKKIINE